MDRNSERNEAGEMEDPVAVLCGLAEEAMRRLGPDFKITVKGDYRKFPLILTITVEEYEMVPRKVETRTGIID